MGLRAQIHTACFIATLALASIDYAWFEARGKWTVFDFYFRAGIWSAIIVLFITGLICFSRTKRPRLYRSYIVIAIISLGFGALFLKPVIFPDKIILRAHFNDDLSRIVFILTDKRTYKLNNEGLFGGNEESGKYTLKGDTIILSEKYPLGENQKRFPQLLLLKDSTIELITNDTNYRSDIIFKIEKKNIH